MLCIDDDDDGGDETICRREHDKEASEKDGAVTWAEQLEAAEQAAKVDEYVCVLYTLLCKQTFQSYTQRVLSVICKH